MEPLQQFIEFITSGENWSGTFGIPNRVFEHLQLSGLAVLLACAVAIPIGLIVGHTRRAEFIVVGVGNTGRALPSFGILALVFVPSIRYLPGDLGFSATLIAMTLLGIPPILVNTVVGVKEVDPDAVEAVRGMGMNGRQVLRVLELPLSVPLIVAGVRNAAVAIVATATLGAVVAWGGLGRFIVDGFAARNHGRLLTGAVLVALLALAVELALGALEKAVSPKGLGPRVYLPGEASLPEPGAGSSPA